MAKTVRINLLVSPQEKAAIDSRTRRANVTTGELVRRAVVSYDPVHDIAEIQTLVDELVSDVSRMEEKLDATLAKVADYEELMADKARLRATARAEIEASGDVWPFELSGKPLTRVCLHGKRSFKAQISPKGPNPRLKNYPQIWFSIPSASVLQPGKPDVIRRAATHRPDRCTPSDV